MQTEARGGTSAQPQGLRAGSPMAPPLKPRCLACNTTGRLTPTMDGADFVCRLAHCRGTWLAQLMRANAAARASLHAEQPTPAIQDAAEAFEAFRWRPDAAPALRSGTTSDLGGSRGGSPGGSWRLVGGSRGSDGWFAGTAGWFAFGGLDR